MHFRHLTGLGVIATSYARHIRNRTAALYRAVTRPIPSFNPRLSQGKTMVREATCCCQSASKHSRSHRRHHRRPEPCHCSDEDRSSVSSHTKDWGTDGTIQDPVPIISNWSEPVLDTHSSGRFQYQARVTPDGKSSPKISKSSSHRFQELLPLLILSVPTYRSSLFKVSRSTTIYRTPAGTLLIDSPTKKAGTMTSKSTTKKRCHAMTRVYEDETRHHTTTEMREDRSSAITVAIATAAIVRHIITAEAEAEAEATKIMTTRGIQTVGMMIRRLIQKLMSGCTTTSTQMDDTDEATYRERTAITKYV
ncbi:hypothetical protein CHU98_g5206 [Xylaria longipes]|nr:hypothetical protein CHU98_g5206 [Xylaria longipes]